MMLHMINQYKPGNFLTSFNLGLSSSAIYDLFTTPSYLSATLSIIFIITDAKIEINMNAILFFFINWIRIFWLYNLYPNIYGQKKF